MQAKKMYSSVLRDESSLRNLRAFISEEYSLEVRDITPARRGYFGETWRLDCNEGRYFAKLVHGYHREGYRGSFSVIDHLCKQGAERINRVVKTRGGQLYTRFEDGILGLFDWINGENIQNKASKAQEYQILTRVYAVNPEGLNITREDFSAAAAENFYAQWAQVKDLEVLALLEPKRELIAHRARRLRQFARLCQEDSSGFVITHGDAGGNMIVNGDVYHLVDWDTPLLSPPERDAWFCMHWPWAMEAFHAALRHNGIDYQLRPERLAYYCYYMFFYYLNAFLNTHFELGSHAGLKDYLSGWIEDSFAFAERI